MLHGFYAEPCRDEKTCGRRQEKQAPDRARWGVFSHMIHASIGTGKTKSGT